MVERKENLSAEHRIAHFSDSQIRMWKAEPRGEKVPHGAWLLVSVDGLPILARAFCIGTEFKTVNGNGKTFGRWNIYKPLIPAENDLGFTDKEKEMLDKHTKKLRDLEEKYIKFFEVWDTKPERQSDGSKHNSLRELFNSEIIKMLHQREAEVMRPGENSCPD